MSVVRGLPAFLMSRICERGTRNFGRESKRGELYAAGVLGILLFVLVLSGSLVLNATARDLVELRLAKFSKLGLMLIWATATLVSYVVLVPRGRYRKWSEDFKNRHALVRERPAVVEALAVGTVLALLILSIVLNWLRRVLVA